LGYWVLNFANFGLGGAFVENHSNPYVSAYSYALRVYTATVSGINHLFAHIAGTGATPAEIDLGAINLNDWHHVAVQRAYDSSQNKYFFVAYLDGRQVGHISVNTAATNTLSWGDIQIGGDINGGRGFPGNVAHVAVYNRVLNQDEIVSRYWHGNRGGAGETTTRRAYRYLNKYLQQRFQVEGTATATTAVTANSTSTLQVSSTLGFNAGDVVIVTNQAYADPSNTGITNTNTSLIPSYNAYNAEILTIASVGTSSLTFTSNLLKAHDVGDVVMTGTQLSSNAAVVSDTKLLQVLEDLETAEQGRFFVKADGRPYFQRRSNRFKSLTTSQRANFSQLNNHGVPYLNPTEWDFDPTMVYNKINVTRTDTNGSTLFSVKDDTSISNYFLRPLDLTLPIASANEARAAANNLLSWYSTPRERVAEVKIDLYSAPQYASRLLSLELGDYVNITKYLTTSSYSLGQDYPMVVEHISINGGPGELTIVLRLSPAADTTQAYAYDNSLNYR
jgi:hypothetical protein